MKLTKKQNRELTVVRHFIPDGMDEQPGDVEAFFARSDRGIGPPTAGGALYWGKQRRDLMVAMYLEDWGSTLSAWDFADEPEVIVRYLAKAMNKPAILAAWLGPDHVNTLAREVVESCAP